MLIGVDRWFLSGDGDGGSDVDSSKSRVLHHDLWLAVLCRLPVSGGRQVLCAVHGGSAVQLSSPSTLVSLSLSQSVWLTARRTLRLSHLVFISIL